MPSGARLHRALNRGCPRKRQLSRHLRGRRIEARFGRSEAPVAREHPRLHMLAGRAALKPRVRDDQRFFVLASSVEHSQPARVVFLAVEHHSNCANADGREEDRERAARRDSTIIC